MSIEAMQNAVEAIDKHDYEMAEHILCQAIEQAQKQEPVAWLDEYGNAFPLAAKQYSVVGKHWKPLYTFPPQRQPLTEEQASDGFDQHSIRPTKLVSKYSFEAGVRYAESAHGITGEKE